MADQTQLEKRISELEIHIAHQDAAIQDLSDMTARQWDSIDALSKQADRLKQHIQALEESSASPAPKDPPPPHY